MFDPDGTLLEGPDGPVSHLICGGVYDGSTGLIYRDGSYFDPMLGVWLALVPLVVVQSWRGRKKKRRGMPWVLVVVVMVGMSGVLAGCCVEAPPTPTIPPTPTCIPKSTPIPTPMPSPEPTPPDTPTPSGKTIYLTFDDGPGPYNRSGDIAEELASEGIEATFFLVGADESGMQRISGFPNEVRTIRDSGHAIGIHGWFHNAWTTEGYNYLGEVQMTHEALTEVLGTLDDRLIRAPFGYFPSVPFEGYEDWYYYYWSPGGDPGDGDDTSAQDLVRKVETALGPNPPDHLILLLHSIRPGTHNAIVEPANAEQDLIQTLRDQGYTQFRKLPRPGDSPGVVIP
jgi:peptidoglycan/xylan/chitin deacetylase (PgdA/CDA1 family)